MAARYLLDTDICVYIGRRRPPAVLTRFRHLRTGEAVMSVVCYGELLYGAEKSNVSAEVRQRLDEFTEFVTVLPLPEQAASRYGAVRAELERTGKVIGNNDLWIAAHALASDLTLVTNNEREFKRVPGLRVENWAQ